MCSIRGLWIFKLDEPSRSIKPLFSRRFQNVEKRVRKLQGKDYIEIPHDSEVQEAFVSQLLCEYADFSIAQKYPEIFKSELSSGAFSYDETQEHFHEKTYPQGPIAMLFVPYNRKDSREEISLDGCSVISDANGSCNSSESSCCSLNLNNEKREKKKNFNTDNCSYYDYNDEEDFCFSSPSKSKNGECVEEMNKYTKKNMYSNDKIYYSECLSEMSEIEGRAKANSDVICWDSSVTGRTSAVRRFASAEEPLLRSKLSNDIKEEAGLSHSDSEAFFNENVNNLKKSGFYEAHLDVVQNKKRGDCFYADTCRASGCEGATTHGIRSIARNNSANLKKNLEQKRIIDLRINLLNGKNKNDDFALKSGFGYKRDALLQRRQKQVILPRMLNSLYISNSSYSNANSKSPTLNGTQSCRGEGSVESRGSPFLSSPQCHSRSCSSMSDSPSCHFSSFTPPEKGEAKVPNENVFIKENAKAVDNAATQLDRSFSCFGVLWPVVFLRKGSIYLLCVLGVDKKYVISNVNSLELPDVTSAFQALEDIYDLIPSKFGYNNSTDINSHKMFLIYLKLAMPFGRPTTSHYSFLKRMFSQLIFFPAASSSSSTYADKHSSSIISSKTSSSPSKNSSAFSSSSQRETKKATSTPQPSQRDDPSHQTSFSTESSARCTYRRKPTFSTSASLYLPFLQQHMYSCYVKSNKPQSSSNSSSPSLSHIGAPSFPPSMSFYSSGTSSIYLHCCASKTSFFSSSANTSVIGAFQKNAPLLLKSSFSSSASAAIGFPSKPTSNSSLFYRSPATSPNASRESLRLSQTMQSKGKTDLSREEQLQRDYSPYYSSNDKESLARLVKKELHLEKLSMDSSSFQSQVSNYLSYSCYKATCEGTASSSSACSYLSSPAALRPQRHSELGEENYFCTSLSPSVDSALLHDENQNSIGTPATWKPHEDDQSISPRYRNSGGTEEISRVNLTHNNSIEAKNNDHNNNNDLLGGVMKNYSPSLLLLLLDKENKDNKNRGKPTMEYEQRPSYQSKIPSWKPEVTYVQDFRQRKNIFLLNQEDQKPRLLTNSRSWLKSNKTFLDVSNDTLVKKHNKSNFSIASFLLKSNDSRQKKENAVGKYSPHNFDASPNQLYFALQSSREDEKAGLMVSKEYNYNITFSVIESIHCTIYEKEELQEDVFLQGTMICSSQLNTLCELAVPITFNGVDVAPDIVVNSCGQLSLSSSDFMNSKTVKITCIPPLGTFVLCRYQCTNAKFLPVRGCYQVREISPTIIRLLLQISIHPSISSSISMCQMKLPFYHKGSILQHELKCSHGAFTVVDKNRLILWTMSNNIKPTTKHSSNNTKVVYESSLFGELIMSGSSSSSSSSSFSLTSEFPSCTAIGYDPSPKSNSQLLAENEINGMKQSFHRKIQQEEASKCGNSVDTKKVASHANSCCDRVERRGNGFYNSLLASTNTSNTCGCCSVHTPCDPALYRYCDYNHEVLSDHAVSPCTHAASSSSSLLFLVNPYSSSDSLEEKPQAPPPPSPKRGDISHYELLNSAAHLDYPPDYCATNAFLAKCNHRQSSASSLPLSAPNQFLLSSSLLSSTATSNDLESAKNNTACSNDSCKINHNAHPWCYREDPLRQRFFSNYDAHDSLMTSISSIDMYPPSIQKYLLNKIKHTQHYKTPSNSYTINNHLNHNSILSSPYFPYLHTSSSLYFNTNSVKTSSLSHIDNISSPHTNHAQKRGVNAPVNVEEDSLWHSSVQMSLSSLPSLYSSGFSCPSSSFLFSSSSTESTDCFFQGVNCYCEVSFEIPKTTLTGLEIDPSSVFVYLPNKHSGSVTVNKQTVAGKYIIWNIHGSAKISHSKLIYETEDHKEQVS